MPALPVDIDVDNLDDCLGGSWLELVEQQIADHALEEDAKRLEALGALASVGSGADSAAPASGPYYSGDSRTTQWRSARALDAPMESTGARQASLLDFFSKVSKSNSYEDDDDSPFCVLAQLPLARLSSISIRSTPMHRCTLFFIFMDLWN